VAGKKLTIIDIGGKRTLGDIINTILGEYGKTIETYEPGVEIIGKRPGERLIDEIRWAGEEHLEETCV
jgi:FlaA1/EpsC-like NDP-sugar epimerase